MLKFGEAPSTLLIPYRAVVILGLDPSVQARRVLGGNRQTLRVLLCFSPTDLAPRQRLLPWDNV